MKIPRLYAIKTRRRKHLSESGHFPNLYLGRVIYLHEKERLLLVKMYLSSVALQELWTAPSWQQCHWTHLPHQIPKHLDDYQATRAHLQGTQSIKICKRRRLNYNPLVGPCRLHWANHRATADSWPTGCISFTARNNWNVSCLLTMSFLSRTSLVYLRCSLAVPCHDRHLCIYIAPVWPRSSVQVKQRDLIRDRGISSSEAISKYTFLYILTKRI